MWVCATCIPHTLKHVCMFVLRGGMLMCTRPQPLPCTTSTRFTLLVCRLRGLSCTAPPSLDGNPPLLVVGRRGKRRSGGGWGTSVLGDTTVAASCVMDRGPATGAVMVMLPNWECDVEGCVVCVQCNPLSVLKHSKTLPACW